MDSPSTTRLIKAAIILPIEGPPLKEGALLLKEDRIEACLSASDLVLLKDSHEIPVYEFGNAIVCPGLINLHTHLEYSLLRAHQAGLGFMPWLKSLIEATRGWHEKTWRLSADLGVAAVLKAGTTCVVENSYAGYSLESLAQAGLRAVVGLELFGVNQDTASDQWQRWLAKLAMVKAKASPTLAACLADKRMKLTVAAHAPYTVCPALWSIAKKWASDNDQIVLAHVAESQNECRWFQTADPELDSHLAFAFGSIPTYKGDAVEACRSWRKGGQTPVQHLENYHLLDEKLLVAHAVQINDADAEILSRRAVSIAHCPRSNSRLRNGVAPLELFCKHKLQFGLGTDSLASNDDLDLLAEARFAVALKRALSPESRFDAKAALEAVTIKAARSIHMDSEIGSFLPGKKADLAVFDFSGDDKASDLATKCDPYELLLYGQCKLKALLVDGQQVHGVPAKSVPARSAPAKV